MELPPRARRIRGIDRLEAANPGTTSACAENTHGIYYTPFTIWNYLRVRGEYSVNRRRIWICVELPPRARRIPAQAHRPGILAGTTSACAENTHSTLDRSPSPWNYLRVRGEYQIRGLSGVWIEELPPRARRIPFHIRAGRVPRGTTSACAENTPPPYQRSCFSRNYLRVRGEYKRC